MRGSGSSEALYDHAARMFPSVGRQARRAAARTARDIAVRCEELGIGILGLHEQSYPPLLATIPDPPPVLYVRGDAAVLRRRSVAVVGTREASPAGEKLARAIAGFACQRGYQVVSGLARGIDTAAHEGAVDGGGGTLAVLAHGLHTVTPAANAELAERIISSGGALVSEHPPGVEPKRYEYVRRNRIQSGLCRCSILVESGRLGGAVKQAEFVRRQGRVLVAVLPGTKETERQLEQGGAKYIIARLGAHGVKSMGELHAVFEGLEAGPGHAPPWEPQTKLAWD